MAIPTPTGGVNGERGSGPHGRVVPRPVVHRAAPVLERPGLDRRRVPGRPGRIDRGTGRASSRVGTPAVLAADGAQRTAAAGADVRLHRDAGAADRPDGPV